MWIESYSLKEREKVSDKFFPIIGLWMRDSPSSYIYSQLFPRYKITRAYITSVFGSITFKTAAPQNVTDNTWLKRVTKYHCTISATKSAYAVPSGIFFVFFFHLNHLLFAGVNNRNVIITQSFHEAPDQPNRFLVIFCFIRLHFLVLSFSRSRFHFFNLGWLFSAYLSVGWCSVV